MMAAFTLRSPGAGNRNICQPSSASKTDHELLLCPGLANASQRQIAALVKDLEADLITCDQKESTP